MSSVYNEPEMLDGLLQECLGPVLNTQPHRDTRREYELKQINEEAFIRQGGSIPERLSTLVKDFSANQYVVLPADPIIAESVALSPMAEVYFVRCQPGLVELKPRELVTQRTPDMVLFSINRFRKRLIADIPMREQAEIDVALRKRQEAQEAKRRDEEARSAATVARRAEVEEELARITARIEFYVETDGRSEVREQWRRMRNRMNEHRGEIMLRDLLNLCRHISIDLTNLTAHLTTATS